MQHIKISPDQEIELRAIEGSTPAEAIQAAIEFVKNNSLKSADLDYFGYLFGIEPDSNIDELVSDYNYYRSVQTF
ncbi:MAG: hypothetical protein M1292_00680 [Bacteroidetes bacterium]|nr:hypothetical protein [Bacteroidota bacterium]